MLNLTPSSEHDEPQLIGIDKAPALRSTRASGVLNMNTKAIHVLADNVKQKGDILTSARISAIQSTKHTHFLIPLCQATPLAQVRVDFDVDVELARVKATVTVATETSATLEMEALTAVNTALMTIYDMMKGVDPNMIATQIHIEEKTGDKGSNFMINNDFENIDF